MKIVVIGAEGFIGRTLAARLIRERALGNRTIEKLLLFDLNPFDLNSGTGDDPAFVSRIRGDIANLDCLREILMEPADVIFHPASIPGGTQEQSYDLSRCINLDATLTLLEQCKAHAACMSEAPSGERTFILPTRHCSANFHLYKHPRRNGPACIATTALRSWCNLSCGMRSEQPKATPPGAIYNLDEVH